MLKIVVWNLQKSALYADSIEKPFVSFGMASFVQHNIGIWCHPQEMHNGHRSYCSADLWRSIGRASPWARHLLAI